MPSIPLACSAGALAELMGTTERSIVARRQDGRLPKNEAGQIDLEAVIKAGVEALALRQRGGSADDLDLNAERARLAKEQADATAMKNEMTRGALLPREDVLVGVQALVAASRARLLSIPAKGAPQLVGIESPSVARDLLTELVNEACAELAAERFAPAHPDRRLDGADADGGDGGMDATAKPDRKRVGRRPSNVVTGGERGAGPMDHRAG